MSRIYGRLLVSLVAILTAQGGAQGFPNPSTIPAPQKFDVASIRPSPPDRSGWTGINITGDRFEARSESLKDLIWYAFAGGKETKTVSGGGGWMDSQNWDIIATIDDPSLAGLPYAERDARVRPMVQTLLKERFHLKLHTETRRTPVYVLVQAKGGAKVKEVSAPSEVQGDSTEAMKRFFEEHPGKPFPGVLTCGERCTGTAATIDGVIGQLVVRTGRLVVDETGLKGHYDFSFRDPGLDDGDAVAEIMEDLGMKLEPRKVEMTTYVIDSAEKPSAN